MIGNKLYDALKYVAVIVLPALAVFYITIAPMWGLPKQEEVAGTIMALDLLLGALLRLSKKRYDRSGKAYDGYLDSEGVDPDTGIPNLKFVVTKDPNDILAGDTAKLKIGPAPKI